jgi:hypothetical protein
LHSSFPLHANSLQLSTGVIPKVGRLPTEQVLGRKSSFVLFCLLESEDCVQEKSGISFAGDVRPMFRQIDIDHMRGLNVFLDDYAFMSQPENAARVRDFLSGKEQPQMPPGGPFWTPEQLARLSQWIDQGCPP